MDQILIKKRKKIFLLIKLILSSFLIASCSNDVDFDKWKKNMGDNFFIKFNKKNNHVFFYDGKFINENFLEGELIYFDDKVLFKSNDKNLLFTLFNFELLKNECEEINYQKGLNSKKYILCNQDSFFDKNLKTKVYKFYFKNYNLFTKQTGIVFFVSKENGVLGQYLVDESKRVILVSEKQNGLTFPERYDYNQYEKFLIE